MRATTLLNRFLDLPGVRVSGVHLDGLTGGARQAGGSGCRHPTAVGTSTFTVDVSDGTGATVRRTFSIAVLAVPTLAIAGGVN